MAEVNMLLNALQAVMEASRALWKWALEETRLHALLASSPTLLKVCLTSADVAGSSPSQCRWRCW